MELNREHVVKVLEKWMKNYDGKVTNFVALGNAVGLIEKLDEENKRLQGLLQEAQEYNEAWVEDNGKLRKELKAIKTDTVRKMQSKLTDTSEFALRADCNGAMYCVDHAAWVEEVAKELLEENND